MEKRAASSRRLERGRQWEVEKENHKEDEYDQ